MITKRKRILIPLGAGILGAFFLSTIYFGIVTWAESFDHAIEFFWQDRWIVIPIILGFGVQVALYVILRFRLFLPENQKGLSGTSLGASGSTSTIAMVACCAHHITDVLPILGLTAAATFLAKYRLVFMGVGLGTTFLGIIYMMVLLIRERQKVMQIVINTFNTEETI
ncbi:MAG: hypothetical protein C0410_03335 [Anaerolinea sp.]|nr:hypothetical protein [Anaerolinea sp.]